MEPDTALVIGLLLAAFSIPAIVSAWSDRRTPRVSALTLLVAFGLVLVALRSADPSYTFADIPEAFTRVAAKWLP